MCRSRKNKHKQGRQSTACSATRKHSLYRSRGEFGASGKQQTLSSCNLWYGELLTFMCICAKAQSQCRKTAQEQNVEMPVPLISQQIVDVPVDVDAEILRHEKAIYQGHTDYAINNLKREAAAIRKKTDFLDRLARVSRGYPRERRELQNAFVEQEVLIRHRHQDVQTCEETLALAICEGVRVVKGDEAPIGGPGRGGRSASQGTSGQRRGRRWGRTS